MLLEQKEILHRPDGATFFLIVSFNNLETYYKTKEACEKYFFKIHLESLPLPRWTDEISEKMGNQVGEGSRILSFKRRINRDELPEIKKKCIQIQKKLMTKDKSLRLIPGYITSHNVVISSIYDDFHRIYIFNGVYAEIVYKFESLDLKYISTAPEFFAMNDVRYFFRALREYHFNSLRSNK